MTQTFCSRLHHWGAPARPAGNLVLHASRGSFADREACALSVCGKRHIRARFLGTNLLTRIALDAMIAIKNGPGATAGSEEFHNFSGAIDWIRIYG
jgi:hypothetical protein